MVLFSTDLKKILARTKLVVMPEDYYLIRLPVDAKPIPGEWYRPATTRFAAFIREPDEITLIVARRKWLRMQNLFEKYKVSGPMKVITFDAKAPVIANGYLAVISSVLAEAKIGFVPISTFNHNHIVVQKADLPRTVRLLRQFLQK